MKKKIKTILISAAFLLAIGALYCTLILPLKGSIIHKAVLTGRVRNYVSQTYGEGFSVDHAGYNFKTNDYICHVKSDTSLDTRFSVYESKDGKLSDSYEFDVLQKENTIWRLNREMDELVVRDFLPIYPGNCVNYMCFFEKKSLDGATSKVRERFVTDMPLDMHQPPLPLELTLWVECDEPSWETLAESLRDAKIAADSLEWEISLYSVTLYSPFSNSDKKPGDALTDFSAYCVPSEMIGDDMLADYLKANAQTW